MGSAVSDAAATYAPSDEDYAEDEEITLQFGGAPFDVSPQAAAAFMKGIAGTLAHVPEGAEREACAAALWTAAGGIWHDRDDEIAVLEDEVQELRARTIAAPNKYELKRACGGGSSARVVVVSSRVPDKADLLSAVLKAEWVVEYDWETATAASIVAAIAEKARALGDVETVALVNHGPDPDGTWAVTKELRIPLDGGVERLNNAAVAALAQGLAVPGVKRIDLLACDLAATPGGIELVTKLEAITGIDFAASDDVTANLKHGGDFTLETDDVDAASIYFDAAKLQEWDGYLRAGLRNGTSKFLRRRRERKKREKRRGGKVRVVRGKPGGPFHHANHDPPACALM